MGMITSVRAPVPVTEIPRQSRPTEVQVAPGSKPGAAPPVAVPFCTEAVHQVLEKPRPEYPPFRAAQVSAAAAAEAAKNAYIRARIAAGLNPLPLP